MHHFATREHLQDGVLWILTCTLDDLRDRLLNASGRHIPTSVKMVHSPLEIEAGVFDLLTMNNRRGAVIHFAHLLDKVSRDSNVGTVSTQVPGYVPMYFSM